MRVAARETGQKADESGTDSRAKPKVAAAGGLVSEGAGQEGSGGIEARMVEVARLSPNPHQPRRAISDESVESLARSIEQTGILQPITVRRRGDGYEVVTGERRWRAAERAGLSEVPVVVRSVSDTEMLELALVENIQREDLNAIDRALAYRAYCEGFDKKPDEVGRRLGEDRTTVVNFLRLLELPDAVRQMVANGLISAGHGRSLLGLGDPAKMALVAREIVKQGLSVREVEEIVRRSKRGEGGGARAGLVPGAKPAKSPHIRDLELRLTSAVGTKVQVEESRIRGRGRIMIEYYSLDDFDRVAQRLGLEVGV
ncbi:MAG: ParB/RepB/Spo0J family partition protein [bacterium]|nr:ParB/RepB/Spo0J family partition protein [bacterium]